MGANFFRSIAVAALALSTALVIPANAQYRQASNPYLIVADVKEFMLTGPYSMDFLGGSFTGDLRDGTFSIQPCLGNGGTAIMTPNPFCPLGTTAFLVVGDVNGDGQADTRSFWSISGLVPALWIAAGFANDPDGIRLSAVPANSTLRGEILQAQDNSITLWYNVLDLPTQQEYDVTRYSLGKEYNTAQLQEMYDDLPPDAGAYEFEFPSKNYEFGVEYIRFLKRVFVEGWPGPTPVAGLGAFRLTNQWVNGALEFDPRFQVTFNWVGISAGNGSDAATVYPLDRLYFSLRDAQTDRIIYPLYPDATPDTDRAPVWLEGDLYSGTVEIGPFFQLGVFDPGDEVVGQLEVRRGLPAGGGLTSTVAAHDYSERIFKWPVRFIDTYEGFAILAYPPGTSDAEIAPNYDFDGDGFTNLEEFGFGTDPARPEDNPSQIVLPRIAADGTCVLIVQKRRFTGDRLDYFAEVSSDGGATWERVLPGNPDWDIVHDDELILEVVSTSPFSSGTCMIRARVR